MNDTSPQVMAKMREMILEKAPEQRLLAGCSMFDFVKKLIVNSVLKSNPDLSPRAIRGEVFKRFYGNDYTESQQSKIIEHLSSKNCK